jgi:hypothetical protein
MEEEETNESEGFGANGNETEFGGTGHEGPVAKLPKKRAVIGILDVEADELFGKPAFNEPETLEAMRGLGYIPEDLVVPTNQVPGLPRDDATRIRVLKELDKRRKEMIRNVIRERNRLIMKKQRSDALDDAFSGRDSDMSSERRKHKPTSYHVESMTEEERKKVVRATHRLNRPAEIPDFVMKPFCLKKRKKPRNVLVDNGKIDRGRHVKLAGLTDIEKAIMRREKQVEKRLSILEKEKKDKIHKVNKGQIQKVASQKRVLAKMEEQQQILAKQMSKKLIDAEFRKREAQAQRMAEMQRREKARMERVRMAEEESRAFQKKKRKF